MDIHSADFLIGVLIDFIITVFAYCTVPIILRLKNGKYEYKKGHKIILINCGVVCLAFIMIRASQGINATSGAVFLYYMVNRAILLKPKEEDEKIKGKEDKKENYSLSFENEKVKKDSHLTYGEDIKLKKAVEQIEEKQLDNLIEKLEQEKIVEPVKRAERIKKTERIVKAKDNRTLLYVVIGILAVSVIGIGIYAFNLTSTYESKIDDLESQISTLKSNYSKLETEKNNEWLENIRNSAKIEFFDENIVFVIDGYGNYYYTYDQMKTVTQGIKEFSYWAYNKEQAISRGYKAWK